MRISFDEACRRLKVGDVVGIPTETVYGLAAALNQEAAIEKIFSLKGRPPKNPLIIHLPHPNDLHHFASELTYDVEKLAKAFWPGPLTLVFPIDKQTIPERARAGLPTAAFRIPNHPLTLKVLESTGPLVMPSANLSGRPSATNPEHVETDFGLDFPVLDGGTCKHGLESTILYFAEDHWQIIRLGAIPAESFEPILGYLPDVSINGSTTPLCPGQLYKHYSPKARLILNKNAVNSSEIVIGFSNRTYPLAKRVFVLGHSSSPEQAAANLYSVLRQLDSEGIEEANIDIVIPQNGLWNTILERLSKAAASHK